MIINNTSVTAIITSSGSVLVATGTGAPIPNSVFICVGMTLPYQRWKGGSPKTHGEGALGLKQAQKLLVMRVAAVICGLLSKHNSI